MIVLLGVHGSFSEPGKHLQPEHCNGSGSSTTSGSQGILGRATVQSSWFPIGCATWFFPSTRDFFPFLYSRSHARNTHARKKREKREVGAFWGAKSVPVCSSISHERSSLAKFGRRRNKHTTTEAESLMVSLEAVLDSRAETETSNISPILINHVYILIIVDFYINFN